MKTNAVPTVKLGDPAHDVATVSGTVPTGHAWCSGVPAGRHCDLHPDELVFTSKVISMGRVSIL